MECPHCNFENPDASAYCEQCGALLQHVTLIAPEQPEYKATPPPPLNGHNALPLPPPLEYSAASTAPTPPALEYATQPQPFAEQDYARIGVFSAFLYFIGILFTILGVLGIVVAFGAGTATGLVGLFLAVILLIISIVIFMRQRQRLSRLHWWHRMLWIVGATVIAFSVLIVEVIAVPHDTTFTNYFTGCVILCYGLAWAGIGIW